MIVFNLSEIPHEYKEIYSNKIYNEIINQKKIYDKNTINELIFFL